MSGGVLSGKALILRVPTYPEGAPRWRRAEKVKVDVVVDESGKVISAQAVSGPPALRDAAVEAAKRARFSPTKLSGVAVENFPRHQYKLPLPPPIRGGRHEQNPQRQQHRPLHRPSPHFLCRT